MVYTREQAVQRSLATRTNVPDTCQYQVRTWLGAPSAGDRDHDGDADAVDGWASEPLGARHTDRNPPAGVPVAWSGGSSGHGHRALSLGGGKIRSTDRLLRGQVSTVDLGDIERAWGLHYLGWSETIDGEPIPYNVPAPDQTKSPTEVQHTPKRLTKVTRACRLLERAAIRAEAKGQTARAKTLRAALATARKAGR